MEKLASWLRSIIQVIFFALLLVPVFGLPLYLEANNALAQDLVVGKREEITMRRLFWSRRLFLDVRYQPVGASITSWLQSSSMRSATTAPCSGRLRSCATCRGRTCPG
jgi:hypothetical protein